MRKKTAVSFLCFLVLLVGCNRQTLFYDCDSMPVPAGTAVSGLGIALDDLIQNDTDYDFSGTVLVAQNGEVVLHKSYGVAQSEGCVPLTNDYAFWLGSLTKQFTAAAILTLQEQGQLNVHDPISQYLNDVPADKEGITLHHLLAHSSGLDTHYAADGIPDKTEATLALLEPSLVYEPGEQYLYSNDGYNLLAIIIESVAGRPYDEYLYEELFAPAGMNQSGFSGDGARWGELFVAEKAPGTNRDGSPQQWDEDWGLRGATGVLSSASDLYKWHQALMTNDILTDESKAQLFAPHTFNTEINSYGYGWQIVTTPRNTRLIAHGGTDDFIGHSSDFRYYVDEGILLIVTSNAGYDADGNAFASVMARELRDFIFASQP
jgi:CubicO group peptidase (beta-lactamase class C family)